MWCEETNIAELFYLLVKREGMNEHKAREKMTEICSRAVWDSFSDLQMNGGEL